MISCELLAAATHRQTLLVSERRTVCYHYNLNKWALTSTNIYLVLIWNATKYHRLRNLKLQLRDIQKSTARLCKLLWIRTWTSSVQYWQNLGCGVRRGAMKAQRNLAETWCTRANLAGNGPVNRSSVSVSGLDNNAGSVRRETSLHVYKKYDRI